MARKMKDLTGQRFGKLAVTGFAGYGHNSRQRVSLWDCACDCGNTCTVQGYLLKNGRRKSCGCIRYSPGDMVGQRFGKLVVLRNDEANHSSNQKAVCRCDCGREKSILTRNLKNGKVLSCGCDKLARQGGLDVQEQQYMEEREQKRTAFKKGDMAQVCTLNDWVYIWLRDVLPNVVKGTTIRMYAETMSNHILPVLGDRPLKGITGEVIQEWVQCLQKVPVPGTQNGQMTEGTVRNILSVLSGCMRDAQKSGLVGKNPCLGSAWTLKAKSVSEQQEWLSEEQVQALEPVLAAYQDEDGYPIGIGFQLVLYAGVTLSEAAALRWKNVDYEQGQIRVDHFVALKRELNGTEEERSYEVEPLAGRKKREVPVPHFLMEQLRQVQGSFAGGAEDFVLRKSEREPVRMDRMRAALMRKSESCGMGTVTPRMLRDTYAMKAVHAGASSDMVAELMGFASPQQVVRRYMPKASMDKKELVKKMFGE